MDNYQNLSNQEALDKLKELAEDVRMCMFCTAVKELPFQTRPMATQEVDAHGNIWFFSAADSDKNMEIKQDDQVQLLYAKQSDNHYLSVYGHADIIRDRTKTEELWNIFIKTWFQEGKDDPNLTLIRVRPESAYYWDTKHGRFISLLGLAASVISGKTMDGSLEGNLII